MSALQLDMKAISAYGVPIIVASLWVLYEYLKAVPVLKKHPWVISWLLLAASVFMYTIKHGLSIDVFSYSLLTCGLIVLGKGAVSKLLFSQFGIETTTRKARSRGGGSAARTRTKARSTPQPQPKNEP